MTKTNRRAALVIRDRLREWRESKNFSQITAATLYEAVAQGLVAALRGREWVDGLPKGHNIINVALAEVPVMHQVKVIEFTSPGREDNQARHGFHSVPLARRALAITNAGASTGRMPANVSLKQRAMVTAGFANDVEAVNQ